MSAARHLKIATVVGARPQFIKAAAVSRAISAHNRRRPDMEVREVLIHTGQHYDYNMSNVFIDELGLPEPEYNLRVGSASHGAQTGEMLSRIEAVLESERPQAVAIYGDTNSTLAGALAAAKLHIPVAHVEAGLRSFNRRMPEEINRVVADHISTWLFCPSEVAVQNLAHEGIEDGVECVGDVMYEVLASHLNAAKERRNLLDELGLKPQGYALATVHRAENADDPQRLHAIFAGLERLSADGLPVVLPLHPRTRRLLNSVPVSSGLRLMEPVSYLDMLCLETYARTVLTDSGGMQKEAYWLGVPCVTLRDETEWTETVSSGWNVLVGCDPARIFEAAHRGPPADERPAFYGDGHAAEHIVRRITETMAE